MNGHSGRRKHARNGAGNNRTGGRLPRPQLHRLRSQRSSWRNSGTGRSHVRGLRSGVQLGGGSYCRDCPEHGPDIRAASLRRRRHRGVRRRRHSADCLHYRGRAGAGHGAGGPLPGRQARPGSSAPTVPGSSTPAPAARWASCPARFTCLAGSASFPAAGP